jgi:hypothetical protein
MNVRHLCIILAIVVTTSSLLLAGETKRVLLLGQKRDHPAASHEYYSGLRVLEKCLTGVPGLEMQIVVADEPCPDVPAMIDKADGIVLFLGEGGRWMQRDAKRLAAVDRLAARGGAIVGLHWGIGAKDDKYVKRHVELMGGMHGGSDRKYVVTKADVKIVGEHPILQGVGDMHLDDEYYYSLKFAKVGKVTPLLQGIINEQPETIAWAFERPDGGRSFGFGGMHYHKNWAELGCRRLVSQGVLWSVGLPIPTGGLPCEVTDADLKITPDPTAAK